MTAMRAGETTTPRDLKPIEAAPLAAITQDIVTMVARGRASVERHGSRPLDVATTLILEDPRLAVAIALLVVAAAIETESPREDLRRPD